MDDVLRRMGYNTVSKCACCVKPGCETIQHVFGLGETANQVWNFFAQSMGMRIQVRSERHVCYEWWGVKIKNRMLKYIADRLPMLILWELWVNFAHCKYGNGKTSVQKIIYKVVRNVTDCIQRKWPSWDPLPPNWNLIMKRAEGFGCGRIVQTSNWCKPLPGSVKVNWTVSMDNLSCGFFIRNSRGGFCLAGVYSVIGSGGMNELITIMLNSCLEWCEQKSYYSVFLETEDWRGLKEDIMDISHLSIKKIQCASRVNCVAKCLVNSCKGSNVIFCSREGLPRGLGRILALEGIPHFVVAPGVDAI